MAISKKTRFEIFKRDKFTCQYCGKKAPDVILEVDHIDPKSKGGIDRMINLVTSCFDCNRGKRDRRLSDNSIIEKQQKQLEQLSEKKEQLDMLLKWRSGLLKIDDQQLKACSDTWKRITLRELGPEGINISKKIIKEFGLLSLLESMDISVRYLEIFNGKPTKQSIELALSKLKGICYMRSLTEEQRKQYQAIWVIKNKMSIKYEYYNAKWAAIYINQFMKKGHTTTELEKMVELFFTYREWENEIKKHI
jgi:hypothetical protein